MLDPEENILSSETDEDLAKVCQHELWGHTSERVQGW